MWQIVAIMVMGFGTDPHVYPLNSERDAIVITHYGSKPLNFITEEKCYTYMQENVKATSKTNYLCRESRIERKLHGRT